MHKNFGEWYRQAGLTIDGETLTKRWGVIDELTYNRSIVLDLLRLAFSDQATEKFEADFRAKFYARDPAFRMRENAAEMAVLSAAALIDLFDVCGNELRDLAILAGFGTLAANFGGLRSKRCLVTDLVERAENFLQTETKQRADWRALRQETDSETLMPILQRALAATADETNILWWLFGETSRDTDLGFSTYDVSQLAYVAGKELSDLAISLPGAMSVVGILDRVVAKGSGNPRDKLAFSDLILSAPDGWNAMDQGDGDLPLCTIRSAVRWREEHGAAWQKKIQASFGIKSEKLSPRDFALQVYWEKQWQKMWQHCT